MTDETIVAVYDTAEHAALAVSDLEAAGVPSSTISQHSSSSRTGSTEAVPGREEGFWASLFGGEPEYASDQAVYERSLENGSTVVTVKAKEQYLTTVMDILERHNPVDIDERATEYGVSRTARVEGAPLVPGTDARRSAGDEIIPLAEETVVVGKRAVNRGTTRIRRYVVETPVEEQVSLRDETISVERRPATGSRPATDADFSEKLVEITETDEEAVVSKTARVKEEVVIRKEATERTETVRDTARREEVEITNDGSVESTTTKRPATDPTNPRV